MSEYITYDTKHPDGTVHGGTVIIIKNNIKHYESEKFQHDYLQATTVIVERTMEQITISAIFALRGTASTTKFWTTSLKL